MSASPQPGSRSRPLRVAGLALLGVALGALIVGLITAGSPRGGGGNAAPTTAPTTGTGGPTGAPTPTVTPEPSPSPTTAPPAAPPVAPPAAPTTAPPVPAPTPTPAPTAPIRVYNNSTITGLAAIAADDFRRNGWQVTEVANYPNARIPTSTVYFRPGTTEEAAARRLAARFNLRVEPRFEGIAGASPGLVVIVTNDYGSK